MKALPGIKVSIIFLFTNEVNLDSIHAASGCAANSNRNSLPTTFKASVIL